MQCSNFEAIAVLAVPGFAAHTSFCTAPSSASPLSSLSVFRFLPKEVRVSDEPKQSQRSHCILLLQISLVDVSAVSVPTSVACTCIYTHTDTRYRAMLCFMAEHGHGHVCIPTGWLQEASPDRSCADGRQEPSFSRTGSSSGLSKPHGTMQLFCSGGEQEGGWIRKSLILVFFFSTEPCHARVPPWLHGSWSSLGAAVLLLSVCLWLWV